MSYNSDLQTNNIALQQILNIVNALPEPEEITLQDKTVTPATSKQEVTADSGFTGLKKVTVNAMPTATQATPSITVSSSGLITASATQSAGYVTSGTKSATKQLTTQGAQTITPSTSDKTIDSGKYLTGTQTIKGDANLVAENIKKGVSIFGVTGTHEGGGGESGGFVEQTGAFDILQLNPTTAIDVDCKLYFPAATYSYDDFYTNSDVLYGTLIEFSDGTKLYGKPDEGWALYLLYRGVEYEIWSSGSWTASAISAKRENTSTFVISKGATVVVNNSGNGYAKARRFMVSNATVTVVSEVANSMFNKIPSSYTINRWDTDITYGGVACAQIQFHTTPEIVLPYDATTENTYIYFDHTGLTMEMQLRAIRIPSTGLAGAKLSDLVFLYDDSGGYVSYGMGLDYGATQEINFALGDNNVGRHILAIHCNGKEICMSSYNQYADSHFPMNFIT